MPLRPKFRPASRYHPGHPSFAVNRRTGEFFRKSSRRVTRRRSPSEQHYVYESSRSAGPTVCAQNSDALFGDRAGVHAAHGHSRLDRSAPTVLACLSARLHGLVGLSLGSMAFLMLWYLTGGRWGITARRIVEAAMRTLPLMAVLFIPLAVGARWLYDWADPNKLAHGRELHEVKLVYLNLTAYRLRGILYFVLWLGLGYLLSKWSGEQDHPRVRNLSRRFSRLSSAGVIIYAFTLTFAAIDWVMSLDASWISTVYGLIFLTGQVLIAICLLVVVETMLANYQLFSEVLTANNLADHGNLMLTFVMLWAYM